MSEVSQAQKIKQLKDIARSQAKKGVFNNTDESPFLVDPIIETPDERAIRLDRAQKFASINLSKSEIKNDIESTVFSQDELEKQASVFLQSVSKPLNSIESQLGDLPKLGKNTPTVKELLLLLAQLGVNKKELDNLQSAVNKFNNPKGPRPSTPQLDSIASMAGELANLGSSINPNSFPTTDIAEAQRLKAMIRKIVSALQEYHSILGKPPLEAPKSVVDNEQPPQGPSEEVLASAEDAVNVLAPEQAQAPEQEQAQAQPTGLLRELGDSMSKLKKVKVKVVKKQPQPLEEAVLQRRQAFEQQDEDDEDNGDFVDNPVPTTPVLPVEGLPLNLRAQYGYNRFGIKGQSEIDTIYVKFNDYLSQNPNTTEAQKDTKRFAIILETRPSKSVKELAKKMWSDLDEKYKTSRGSGVKNPVKHDRLKLKSDGTLGSLQFDMNKFNKMYVSAKRNGKKVAEGPMSADLMILLTKRFNPKRNYDPKAIEAFKNLIRLAEVDFTGVASKDKIMRGELKASKPKEEPKETVKLVYWNSTDELLERLQLLIGERDAGNKSNKVIEEATQLASILKGKNIITPIQYESIIESLL